MASAQAQRRKDPGGALGTPNKEQKGANKKQNLGKKDQNGPFWGVVFHENTSSNSSLD